MGTSELSYHCKNYILDRTVILIIDISSLGIHERLRLVVVTNKKLEVIKRMAIVDTTPSLVLWFFDSRGAYLASHGVQGFDYLRIQAASTRVLALNLFRTGLIQVLPLGLKAKLQR